MKKFAFALSAVMFVFQSVAYAQGQSPSHVPPANQVMTFSDELVAGQLVRPDETTVRGNRFRTGISLLRVRQHFVQEMFRSVENL